MRPLVALLVEPPEPFRPKCRLGGATSTNTAAIASSAPVTYTVARSVPAVGGEHRQPQQQRRDARLREARDQPRQQPREHARAEQHVAPAALLHSTTVVTAIITIARNRP